MALSLVQCVWIQGKQLEQMSQCNQCKASKLSGKRKSCLRLQDLLYMQGGLPPALKGSDRICSRLQIR